MSRRANPLLTGALAIGLLLAGGLARADDEFTLYELLDPATNSFAITFDVTTSRAGAAFYLNGIRAGSVVSDERVIDRASGRDLHWELISGADAKAAGLMPERVADDAEFLKVHLAEPVPAGGEARLRIIKTYSDAASYWAENERIVFERGLGIQANAVALPAGYELARSSVPTMTSTLPDGRVKVSFLNDRGDTLPVRVEARRAGGSTGTGAGTGAGAARPHRAEQDREITYWLNDPTTASFKISHDFTASTPGQRYVHNFVRAGSQVEGSEFYDLNRGQRLASHHVTGAQVNELGFYPNEIEPQSEAIQAELIEPIPEGHTVRIRVIETYTDHERYYMDGDELVWDRTLGRPRNVVTLPAGWALTSLSTPARIYEDDEGRVAMRFVNPRNDSLHVVIRAKRRGN